MFGNIDTELLADGSEFLEILLVLLSILDLDLECLKQSDGGGVVVDASGGLESLFEHRGGGNQIVREDVVEETLDLEKVISFVEFLFESGNVLVRDVW